MKKIILLVAALLSLSIGVYAHSGRTDSNGGHWNHKTGTYHYHSGPKAGQTFSSDPTGENTNYKKSYDYYEDDYGDDYDYYDDYDYEDEYEYDYEYKEEYETKKTEEKDDGLSTLEWCGIGGLGAGGIYIIKKIKDKWW